MSRTPCRIYQVPLMLEDAGLGDYIVELLALNAAPPDLAEWQDLCARIAAPKPPVRVAVVGKYVEMPDSYISVTESLRHAAVHAGVDLQLSWVNSENLDTDSSVLDGVDGIVVPGGFGHRGIEGKVLASRYARRHKIPYLGLCLGMQCAVVDIAREVIDAPDANSTEFNAFTSHPIIDLLPEQRDIEDKGGTMRLGVYPCKLDCPAQKRRRHMARRWSTSGTAIASSSTTITAMRWCRRASSSPEHRPTAAWSRSSSCAITPSSSARSFIRSSVRDPGGRTRCSATSWSRPLPAPACSQVISSAHRNQCPAMGR